MQIDWPQLVSVIGSALGGAFGAGALFKILIKKLISDNEKKHADTEKKIEKMADNLFKASMTLEIINTRMTDVLGIRAQVTEHDRDLAVIKKEQQGINKDLKCTNDNLRHMKERVLEHDAHLTMQLRREGKS